MWADAKRLQTDKTHDRKRAGLTPRVQILPARRPFAGDGVLLQRRSACACGGGCPMCQSNLPIQTKLAVSQPGDIYEQEADQVAEQVTQMAEPTLQRTCASCTVGGSTCPECAEEKERLVQRKTEGASDSSGSVADNFLHDLGPGQPLNPATRTFFEPRFGHDFSQVRVHADTRAAESARAVNALAYTIGRDLVFSQGQYAPETSAGQKLLAHELTHVIQQREAGMDTVQRQNIGREDAPEFGELQPEPHCPGRTQLGRITPDPPCPPSETEVDDRKWKKFQFCVGSDVFVDPDAAREIRNFAREHPALARFTLHAYASVEGDPQENKNLACHRARRVAREVINAGVLPEQITVFGKKPTWKFGSTLKENRVVTLNADIQQVPGLSEVTNLDPEEIINVARESILAGSYRLAADAYVSFWTCGQIPTLRDAVSRVELRVEPARGTSEEGDVRLGLPLEAEEFNQIILRPEIFETVNPLECVIARIIDMSFHHMVLPHLPGTDKAAKQARHSGGLFLVELAGFLPCHDPLLPELPTLFGKPWWLRPTVDPLVGFRPEGCTRTGLPGPQITERGHPRLGKKPVAFELESSSTRGKSGTLDWKVDLQSNTAEIGTKGAIEAEAKVRAIGDTGEFPNYQIGFVRTVLQDYTEVQYASGFTLYRTLPAPLRDAAPTDQEPWTRSSLVTMPSESESSVSIQMLDDPDPSPIKFLFAIAPANRRPIDPIAEDIVSMATRHVRYGLWSVARRVDAPLDRFNTDFIDGTVLDVAQIVDVVNTKGEGRFDTKVGEPIADAAFSRLSGPIPSDFQESALGAKSSTGLGEKRIVGRRAAPRREEVTEALDKKNYRERLQQIAEPIRLEFGLTQDMSMVIAVDTMTGRMPAPIRLGGLLPVQAGAEGVPKDVTDSFAERFFAVARKEMVLKREGHVPGSFENITVHMSALGPPPATFKKLHERIGVIDVMRKLWRATENDDFEAEWSATLVIDRQTNKMRAFTRRGSPETKDEQKTVPICLPVTSPLGLHESVLGTIHTHPATALEGIEEPSKHDREFVAEPTEDIDKIERRLCGVEHYVIGHEHVFQYTSTKVNVIGKRKDILAE